MFRWRRCFNVTEIQLECSPSTRTRKIYSRKTEKATTTPKLRTESSQRGESRYAGTSFMWSILTSFQYNFPNSVRTKRCSPGRIGLHRQILLCQGIRSFWSALVRTVHLGSTDNLCLGRIFIQVKLVFFIKNDPSYDADGSFVLLGPKYKFKLLTQSTHKWICKGKWVFEILAAYFVKNEKAQDDQTFLLQCGRYHSPGIKINHPKSSTRGKEKYCLGNFQFSQKWL